MWVVVVVFFFVGGVRCGCSFFWLGAARGCGLCSFCSSRSSSVAFSRSFPSCRRSSSVAVPACSSCVASPAACWLLCVVALLGALVGFALFVGASACWLPSLVCSSRLSLFCRVLPLVLRSRLFGGAAWHALTARGGFVGAGRTLRLAGDGRRGCAYGLCSCIFLAKKRCAALACISHAQRYAPSGLPV